MRDHVLIGIAALCLGACDVKQATPSGETTAANTAGPISQDEAERIVGAAHASFTGGDAFKIMEHYAPGAVMFDPTHVEPSSDRAIQTKWTADFVAMKPSDLVTQSRDVKILDDDTIVASGIAAFLANVGPNRQRLSTRYTQVFQRQPDGSWKIVQEHMSLPPAPPGPGV